MGKQLQKMFRMLTPSVQMTRPARATVWRTKIDENSMPTMLCSLAGYESVPIIFLLLEGNSTSISSPRSGEVMTFSNVLL